MRDEPVSNVPLLSGKVFMPLSLRRLVQLHQLIANLELDRESLLEGIDERFIACLSAGERRSAAALQDLLTMNSIERLPDGSAPLRILLSNAIRMTPPGPVRRSFERFLVERGEEETTMISCGVLDEVPFPWWRAEAGRLRDILMSAYSEVGQAEHLARSAGIGLGRWRSDAGIETAWNSLVEVAAAQGKLRDLVTRVLGDNNVAAYHPRIRDCIGLSASGVKQTIP